MNSIAGSMDVDPAGQRVLIVEDDPKLGHLLIDYLTAGGYQPHLLADGNQVLPYVHQTPPELIVLALMLPGSDRLTLPRDPSWL